MRPEIVPATESTDAELLIHPDAGDVFAEVLTANVNARGQDRLDDLLPIFGSVYVQGKRRPLKLRLSDKPTIKAAVEAVRRINADRKAAEDAKRQAERDAIIRDCPAGCEACTQNWSNGDLPAAEYVAPDGTTLIGSDLLTNQGQGIYYLPKSMIEEARAKAAADASEKTKRANKALLEFEIALSLAKRTGEPAIVKHWTETRRAKEDGVWGEYQFAVTRFVRPDGSSFETAQNCY